MTDEDQIVAIDEGYTANKSDLSIREIILRHVRKISDLSCQELTESYWEERPVKIGSGVSIIKKYHPDLRCAFINAVDFLYHLIAPYTPKDTSGNFKKEVGRLKKSEDNKWKSSKDESQSDWVDKKLDMKKKLFAQIMLFLHKIKFFQSDDYSE